MACSALIRVQAWQGPAVGSTLRQQPPFRKQLLVVLPSADLKTGESTVLAEGRDFYSAPRLNADSTNAS